MRLNNPLGIAVTEDGEAWTTETERENDVYAIYSKIGVAANTYILMISLLNENFPHRIQGQPTNRIDITSIYYSIDVAANTKASLQYGVITRIDGVDADIRYFTAIPFLSGALQEDRIESLRAVPSQVKLDHANGELLHGITNVKEDDVVAVNTGLQLDSPHGVLTPAIGDLILKYDHTAGSSNFATFVFYHTQ